MHPIVRISVVALAFLMSVFLLPHTAQAAGVVGNGTPASCTDAALAQRLVGGGLVTFNCGSAPHTIIVNTHVINANTTVDGGGRITLDGESLRQIFLLQPNRTLTLRNIVLKSGNFSQGGCLYVSNGASATATNVTFHQCLAEGGVGGAVYNLGTFTATYSRFTENQATGTGSIDRGRGGAVHNSGNFIANYSIFRQNRAQVHGGAIFSFRDATVTDSRFEQNVAQTGGGGAITALRELSSNHRVQVVRSLFVDNTAATFGGAVYNLLGEISVVNSTFSNNQADRGGAIYGDGLTSTSAEFSTIFRNRADLGGGLFLNAGGTFTLTKSIVAESRDRADTSPQLNCDSGGASYTSGGYNIIGDNSCLALLQVTDLVSTNPQLGALQDNGGFSFTHRPANSSPALNKIPIAQCTARDQRRHFRVGANCDIGAVEVNGGSPRLWAPLMQR